MEDCDAVATSFGTSGVGVGSCDVQFIATEGVAATVADADADGITQIVFDSKVQHGDAVATSFGTSGVGVGSCDVQFITAEGVAATVADADADSIAEVVLDSEVEDCDAIAAFGSSCGIGVCTCDGQVITSKGIAATVADADTDGITHIILDGEVEDNDAVATFCGTCGVGVSSCDVQIIAAEGIAATVADADADGVTQIILDSEVEDCDTVTTLCGASGIGVCASDVQVITTEGIAATVAYADADGIAEVVLDSEVEDSDAVATRCGTCRVGIGTCDVKFISTEGIAATVADADTDGIAEVVLNGKMEDSNAVATFCSASGIGVGSRDAQIITAESIAATVADADADGIAQVVLDSEVEDGDAVTTLCGTCGIGVSTCDVQFITTEGIAATVADADADGVAEIVFDCKVQDGDAVATF